MDDYLAEEISPQSGVSLLLSQDKPSFCMFRGVCFFPYLHAKIRRWKEKFDKDAVFNLPFKVMVELFSCIIRKRLIFLDS